MATDNMNGDVEAIFDAARKLSTPAARKAFLDAACAENQGLRRQIEELLTAQGDADQLFEPVVAAMRSVAPVEIGGASKLVSSPTPEEKPGERIGRYKLREKVGEGGCGVVYVAEQEEPVRRKVALKVIKLGMDTKSVIARFEAERQALAMMDHPNIARVFDAGTTETGRPYFVMELVRGVRITDYCDENKLSTRERLDLFIQVCQAVQHAHQKGIIHRDLKPSNILVTINDDVAVPKVIDFGIAKAVEGRLSDHTVYTELHQLIGTPAYMSPEQAVMTSLDIDTRSDIYSLGVLLYELLTGKTPFDPKELLKSGLDEMRRTLRETEPPRPSTRLGTLSGDELTTTAQRRRTDAPKLVHQLRGDLDWIVMKCLEKDRTRRYETANGLAADLRRHLNNEPVTARPPSAAYRFQKMVRRNKLQFAAGMFALAVLVLAVAVSSWQALRANRERARAERRLQATVQLMNEAFENVVPSLVYTIGATKPREDLANAAVAIVKELQEESEFSPEFRRVLGQLYLQASLIQSYYMGNTTGDYAEGLKFALQAIRILQGTSPGDHDETRLHRLARAQMSAGFAAHGLLRFEEALEYFKQMRHTAGLLRKSTNTDFAQRGLTLDESSRWLTGWTFLQMDRAGEALTNCFIPLLNECKKRVTNLDTAKLQDIWDFRDGFDSVGRCNLQLNRRREAVEHFREALRLSETNNLRNPNHAACATMFAESKAQLGEALLGLGKQDEALPLLEGALRMADNLRKLDPPNPGFIQLKVQILRSHSAGYIAWAEAESDPASERLQRLEKAGELLSRADQATARVKSGSLRKFLRHDLDSAQSQLDRVKEKLKGSATATSVVVPVAR